MGSTGPFGIFFSELEKSEGAEMATFWNEEMALAQRTHPGRFWGTAAVPLIDTATAIAVVDHAAKLGLRGVNLPGSIGNDARIDAERLEPFYDRVEELGLPLFLHPTDAIFLDLMYDGYNGALFMSLGRVVEVSTAAMRLVLSGIMARHPKLIVVMSHTGGALPYQAGRMDKNSKRAQLPEDPSVYLKRMYTDTVSAHAGHEDGDRVLRRRPRDVRQRLSVLDAGRRAALSRGRRARRGRQRARLERECTARSAPGRTNAGGGAGPRSGRRDTLARFAAALFAALLLTGPAAPPGPTPCAWAVPAPNPFSSH